jgi:hypothetical protein
MGWDDEAVVSQRDYPNRRPKNVFLRAASFSAAVHLQR